VVERGVADGSEDAEEVDDDGYSIRDSFNLLVLGDLHLEDDMTCHHQARDDCLYHLSELSLLPTTTQDGPILPSVWSSNGAVGTATTTAEPQKPSKTTVRELLLEVQGKKAGDLSASQLELLLNRKRRGETLGKSFVVSLGDLGRKDIRHLPGDAGTTQSFWDARDYLDSFQLPYELVSGNHDLEGLDEFGTDEDNLRAWMECFDKPTPQFCKRIGARTLLVGLSTVRFRAAPFSSHEVHVDDEQVRWFLDVVESHPAHDGWKILVFSHAPIMGSGLRVLQNVHVVNGCAWLNHCDPRTRNLWIRTVRANPQIKAWFSGHFHLSHDYEDALSVVGSCVFVQVGVVGRASTRDGKRQTRLVQGNGSSMQIYTINHHVREEESTGGGQVANLRLDANIDFATGDVTLTHGSLQDLDRESDWFQAYSPAAEDGYVRVMGVTVPIACLLTQMLFQLLLLPRQVLHRGPGRVDCRRRFDRLQGVLVAHGRRGRHRLAPVPARRVRRRDAVPAGNRREQAGAGRPGRGGGGQRDGSGVAGPGQQGVRDHPPQRGRVVLAQVSAEQGRPAVRKGPGGHRTDVARAAAKGVKWHGKPIVHLLKIL
jgi:Calcineurin-like phosphoesterase